MGTFTKKFVLTIDPQNSFDIDAEGLSAIVASLRDAAPEYFEAPCDAGMCQKYNDLITENNALIHRITELEEELKTYTESKYSGLFKRS